MGIGMSITTLAENKVETTIAADFVSSYIWRGQDLGSAAVQPTLGVGFKGLSLTAWGSYGLANASDAKELDLTLAYTIGGLNLGVTDYWFDRGGLDPDGRYFKYDAHGTNHVFEANVGYDFGFASLQWFTNFAGNDYKADGKRAFSSYVEVAVPFKLVTVNWTAAVGAVPFESAQYRTNGFAVTNVSLKATKEIKVTDTFSIPVFGQLVGNPCSQKAYLVFGFTLQP
jgi:hypothetical protein